MPESNKTERPLQSSSHTNAKTHAPHRHKVDPVRRRHHKMNNHMILILLIASVLVIAVFVYNIFRVHQTGSISNNTQSLSSDTDRNMKNDLYEIGNNPTQLEQTYFQQLTDALKSGTKEEQVTALAENFVSDYFTWTNKDGNYEVGGLQYIYGAKVSAFDTWSRYNYYKDMDLYISQYGREHLPEVTEVTVEQPATETDDYTVSTIDTPTTYNAWLIDLSWKYKMGGKVPSDNFINSARFLVVDDDGRMEIAEWYDLKSVYAWSEANGVDPNFSNSSSTKISSSAPASSQSASSTEETTVNDQEG